MAEEIGQTKQVAKAPDCVIFLFTGVVSHFIQTQIVNEFYTLDSSSLLCFLPKTLFRRFVASILRLRPSGWNGCSASLVAVVLGLVSESYTRYEHFLQGYAVIVDLDVLNNLGFPGHPID